MTDWCILRCAGANTLRLSRSLGREDFEVWTPEEVQVKRVRRTHERVERVVAVMPTYIFAKARHIVDLFAISQGPDRQHPSFSVFHHLDRIPLVEDRELYALRQIERRAALTNKPVVFAVGTAVRASDGPFEGLTGQVVETSKGQFTLVAFPRFHIPVKFSTWQLSDVELQAAASTAFAA